MRVSMRIAPSRRPGFRDYDERRRQRLQGRDVERAGVRPAGWRGGCRRPDRSAKAGSRPASCLRRWEQSAARAARPRWRRPARGGGAAASPGRKTHVSKSGGRSGVAYCAGPHSGGINGGNCDDRRIRDLPPRIVRQPLLGAVVRVPSSRRWGPREPAAGGKPSADPREPKLNGARIWEERSSQGGQR